MYFETVQLTDRQVEVLEWIERGCPEGHFASDNHYYRVVAKQLQNKGLAKVHGSGTSWGAEITEAGIKRAKRLPSHLIPDGGTVDDLFELVLKNKTVPIPEDQYSDESCKYVLRASATSPKRPHGKQLAVANLGRWNAKTHYWYLTEYFREQVPEVEAIAIPDTTRKVSQLVRDYQKDRDWHRVTNNVLPRAMRVLDGLISELQRNGYEVTRPRKRDYEYERGYYDRQEKHWHFSLSIDEDGTLPSEQYYLSISEECKREENERRSPYSYSASKAPEWMKRLGYKPISTEILTLHVESTDSIYSKEYKDTKTITLESRLPRLLQDLEINRLKHQYAESLRKQEKDRRQAKWEQMLAKAAVEIQEKRKWEHFETEEAQWRKARQLREYLEAYEAATYAALEKNGHTEDRRKAFAQWIGWCKRRIDEKDPLQRIDGQAPDVPLPTSEEVAKLYADNLGQRGPESVPSSFGNDRINEMLMD